MEELAKENSVDTKASQTALEDGRPSNIETQDEAGKSKFTGGMLANFFIDLLTAFVSLITLGLAFPAMTCWKLKWKARRTYFNGYQLDFDGKGMQLMGKYIQWAILSIITLGLYYIFSAKVKYTAWETKHTHFANYKFDDDSNSSKFTGKWYQLFVVNFICRFVTLITIGFGYYWAHCYKERWYAHHKTIDGCDLEFDGTGMQYFCKRIVWTILTFITLGIYGFWLQIKSIKWTISHTKLLNTPNGDNFIAEEEAVAEEEVARKLVKTKGYKTCFNGFVVSTVGAGMYVLSDLIFMLYILTMNKGGGSEVSTIIVCIILQWSSYILGIVGFAFSVKGFKRIELTEIKARNLAIVGIVLGGLLLFMLVHTTFGDILSNISRR